jgi:heme/copper-type cytochrome/quinol oxidase subunit 4
VCCFGRTRCVTQPAVPSRIGQETVSCLLTPASWEPSHRLTVYITIRSSHLTYSAVYRTLGFALGEVTLPRQPFQDEPARRRKTALVLFYLPALFSVIAISLEGRIPSLRGPLLVLSIGAAAAAILFLWGFLRLNDEHEQQINYRALTFAFIGTLIFSAAVGFLQMFGFHSVSWLGIPTLMITLWSIGLILYSWRYR